MLAEIKQTLYRNYQLDLSADEIRELSLNDLLKIGGSNSSPEATSPIENNISSSSYLPPHETLVTLNVNDNGKNVYFLHPIEGHVDSMRELSTQLNANVHGFQYTKECKFGTIETISAFYLQRIKEIQDKGPYYLCGYSFGAVLAFEIGLQLEKMGDTVEVFSVDGSPLYMKNFLVDQVVKKENSIERIQQSILTYFAATFTNIDLQKVRQFENYSNTR